MYKITLQFVYILHPLFLHHRFTQFRFLPAGFIYFVGPNMNVWRRKNGDNFIQYILYKSIHLLFTRTKRCREQLAPANFSINQFRKNRYSSHHMSWHINFWNNFYMTFCRISYQFSQFLLRIISTIKLLAVFYFDKTRVYLEIRVLFCQFHTYTVLIIESTVSTLFC
ncbi:hypothetical protein D3C85_1075790 [compost metagenome]